MKTLNFALSYSYIAIPFEAKMNFSIILAPRYKAIFYFNLL